MDKVVLMPAGTTARATEKALLHNDKLGKEAREIEILPEKHNLLMSDTKLLDAGYTTVFNLADGGVNVYWSDNIVINDKKEIVIQGWRDKSGLWRIPIKKEVDNINTDTLLLQRPVQLRQPKMCTS